MPLKMKGRHTFSFSFLTRMLDFVGMENQTTGLNETTSISIIPKQQGPSLLTIILMVISAWIVLANTLILLFLVINRKALKTFVNLQILSFSVTDTLVGLSAVPTSLTYKLALSFPYFEPCAAILCAYSVAQAATLYHAFVICIHRLITIKRCTGRPETNPRNMYKTLLVQVSIPWIESILVVSIPFIVFGRRGKIIQGCSLNIIFEDDYIHAMAFLNVNLLTPQIGMNVVYIYMLVFLLRQWRRVNSLRGNSKRPATTSDGIWNTSQGTSAVDTKTTLQYTTGDRSNVTANNTNKSEIYSEHNSEDNKNIGAKPIDELGKDTKETPSTIRLEHQESVRFIKTKTVHLNDDNNGNEDVGKSLIVDKRIESSYHTETSVGKSIQRQTLKKREGRLGINGQKDVVITIGLLLIILNVSMTPLTFLAVVESLNINLLGRQTKFIIMVLALMNSALNPVIYIFRIKPFREALKAMWKKAWAKICR